MFYDNCVKMFEDFALSFGVKRTGCCIMTTHLLILSFSPGNSSLKTTELLFPTHPTHLTWPPANFLFPQLKGRHFDTVEVIMAESQAVLNTLREYYFQVAFKKLAEALGTVHMSGRGLLRG
jgi:hypothetical protein